MYLSADDGTNGDELWKSDGTAAGTVLVKDINLGTSNSDPANLTAAGNLLFFTADDGTHGSELWESDGTAAGTVLVKDINAGAGGSDAQDFLAIGSTLYFSADDPFNGNQLWKSDGTAAGTVPVVIPGVGGILHSSYDLTAVGNSLFFFHLNGPINVDELWKTDGTPAGSVLLEQFTNSSPANLTAVGNSLFFSADDNTNGNGLWTSDGTAAGTTFVKAFNPGFGSSSPPSPSTFADLNVTLVFAVNDGTDGTELWTSDGTSAGTVLAKDIFPGPGNADTSPPIQVGIRLFFAANDTVDSRQLWSIGPLLTSKIGVERASPDGSATLTLDSNGNGTYDGADSVFTFGLATDTFLVGDWSGASYDSIGVVRPTSSGVAQFSLDANGNNAFDAGDRVFSFGLNTDTFLVGDWNGDGHSNIGVVRPGADGVPVFSLDTNGDGIFESGGIDTVTSFGLNGDTFLIGDWNGSGTAKIGVVRPGPNDTAVFSLDTNGDGVFDAGDSVFSFGLNTDTVVVGDWNGSGTTKIGVVRPAPDGTATFSLDTNGDGVFDAGDQVFSFGLASDHFFDRQMEALPAALCTPATGFGLSAPYPGGMKPDATFVSTVDQAVVAWQQAGLPAQLVSHLENVNYSIGTLTGGLLGETSGNNIVIDATAQGHGWSENATPQPGQMDLFTVLSHEMGHELGLPDQTTNASDLMFESLLPGLRKTPNTQDMDLVFATLVH